MTRRSWIALAATGAAAAAAGAGFAWWRLTSTADEIDVNALLFTQTFPDAGGKPQPLAQWRGKLLVVNFWATWCAPCVEEMPDLQAVRDEFAGRGVEIIGLGIDKPESIAAFRAQLQLSLPLLVAGAAGSEIGRAMGNLSGALPYTALVARTGRIVQRKLGRIRAEELRLWLKTHI